MTLVELMEMVRPPGQDPVAVLVHPEVVLRVSVGDGGEQWLETLVCGGGTWRVSAGLLSPQKRHEILELLVTRFPEGRG
jgi:hypothetical protein